MKVNLSGVSITSREKKYVCDVIKSGILSLGKYLVKFEKLVSEYTGRKYAIAVSSGTAGLFLLLKYYNLKKTDEIITTPFSFIASANVILHAGATPVFADIDEKTFCFSNESIESLIKSKYKLIKGKLINKDNGNTLRGLLPVDIFGIMPDYRFLEKIAKKYNLFIIEDSCEAFGSDYYGKKAGSFGHGSVLAFYPNKQITTGEGGMVLTDSKAIYEYVKAMRNQGRKDMDLWLNHSLMGYNFRIDEMSCAMGAAQMERLNNILTKRNGAAQYYFKKLKDIKGIIPGIPNPYGKTGWFVYVIRVNKKHRNKMMDYMISKGIGVRPYFTPIHLQPFYRKEFDYSKGDFSICEKISNETIAIPFFTDIKRKEQDYVLKTIRDFINAGT